MDKYHEFIRVNDLNEKLYILAIYSQILLTSSLTIEEKTTNFNYGFSLFRKCLHIPYLFVNTVMSFFQFSCKDSNYFPNLQEFSVFLFTLFTRRNVKLEKFLGYTVAPLL